MTNIKKAFIVFAICVCSIIIAANASEKEKPNYSSSVLTVQAASEDITGEDVIAIAMKYRGSYGEPFMRMFNPYIEFPYCSAFVAGIYQLAGFAPNEKVGYTTFVDETADGMFGQVQYFKARGLYQPSIAYGGAYYIPQVGEVIIFCWEPGKNKGQHTGIITYSDGYSVWTIEGNTSDGTVKENCYRLDSPYIMGFGKVRFSGSSSSSQEYTAASTTTSAAVQPITTTTTTTVANTQNTGTAAGNSYGVIEITSDIGCRVHSGASIGSPCIGIASTYERITYDYVQGEFYHVVDCEVENSIYTVNGFIHNSVCYPVSQYFVQGSGSSGSTSADYSAIPGRGRIISPIGAWQRWAPELSDGMYSFENPGSYDTRVGILDTNAEFEIIEECGNFYKIRSNSFGTGYIHNSVMEVIY